jgi:hypothetical protein|eukprot:COSAG01_NODE_7535_length_3161_cov_4.395820_2_plen_102_part_00
MGTSPQACARLTASQNNSNNTHGLPATVCRFYFDDGWSDKADPVPRGQPSTYHSCNNQPTGGATEMNPYCVGASLRGRCLLRSMQSRHRYRHQCPIDCVRP